MPKDIGLRCLWLRFAFRDVPPQPRFVLEPELEEELARYPRRRVPQLERSFRLLDLPGRLILEEAWLVTIVP